MNDLNKQIEEMRDKLNFLIDNAQTITNNEEILKVSTLLDKLINKYMLLNKLNIYK